MLGKKWVVLSMVILLLVSSLSACAKAQSPAPTPSPSPKPLVEDAAKFYKGKTIEFLVPVKPGGSQDIATRIFAPFIEEYTGATVVVKNIAGADNMASTNYLYETSKRDGLTINNMLMNQAVLLQLMGSESVRFDLKKFNFIANLASGDYALVVNPKTPYKTLNDLIAAKNVVTFPATSPAAGGHMYNLLVFKNLGMNIKSVTGFDNAQERNLAVARGEFDGQASEMVTLLPLIKDGMLRPICVLTKERDPRLPNVPTIYEATTLTGKAKEWNDFLVGVFRYLRTVFTTPDVPQERVEFLRQVFEKAAKRSELIEQFAKQDMPVTFIPGEQCQKEVLTFMGLTKEQIDYMKKTLMP